MRPYYDAGLKNAGSRLFISCYPQLQLVQFILESWESLYRVIVLQHARATSNHLLTDITIKMLSMPTELFFATFNHHLCANQNIILQTSDCSSRKYRQHMALVGSEDAMAYVVLLTFICCSWKWCIDFIFVAFFWEIVWFWWLCIICCAILLM